MINQRTYMNSEVPSFNNSKFTINSTKQLRNFNEISIME